MTADASGVQTVAEPISVGAPECMNGDQLAAFLGLNRKTVYEYAARRVIPSQRVGRRFLFSRAAVLAWLARSPSLAPIPARRA